MTAPKYLRQLAVDYGVGAGHAWRSAALDPALRAAEVHYLAWMYERYALPLPSSGIWKVNIGFTLDGTSADPTELLDVACVCEPYDAEAFRGLSPGEQQYYQLERIHAAMLRCAGHFGWAAAPLAAARERIVREQFRFAFDWRKPLASSDRRHRAQIYVEAANTTKLFVVFSDAHAEELRRVHFLTTEAGSGIPEILIRKLAWRDAETLMIVLDNGQDYWLCSLDGKLEFHDPRAEAGHPQMLYRLGQRYCDPRFALHDPVRGRELIQSAAAKGDAHARRAVERGLP